MPSSEVVNNHAAFVWSVADLLRGDYKQSEYGRVILPMTVLARLDAVLAPTREQVVARYDRLRDHPGAVEAVLTSITGVQFYNTSKHGLEGVLADTANLDDQLRQYILRFSPNIREIFDKFNFDAQIARLAENKLLYRVLSRFTEIDLHPDTVSNHEMGYLYEELIRKFSELSNETAGEHFTPREVIELMVALLFADDADDSLRTPGVIKTMLDPACGTGGMLTVAERYLTELNPDARLAMYGQELNAETYAVCQADMLLKAPEHAANIVHDNSFSNDGHAGMAFDYLLANPPFGVEWKKVRKAVEDEHEQLGFAGRFGAGTPRINDGSFLFLQHMISKMKRPEDGGTRLAIVFNGSPLFTGAAGSGESEIRRWIIEHDWLDAVVALPDQLFYNTGISTYFWIVTNRKAPERRGKVQLIDARESWTKMRKSLGEKRKCIDDEQIADIVGLYAAFEENDRGKIFPNTAFGFLRITIERPKRRRWEITDETLAAVYADRKLAKLDSDLVANLVATLVDHRGLSSTDLDVVKGKLDPVLDDHELTNTQQRVVYDALAVPDCDAPVITNRNGEPEPDTDLRDQEQVPLPDVPVSYEADVTERLETVEYRTAIDDYVRDEVLPWVPDAWVDHSKTRIGYEIPLTRHFYVYEPPRPLDAIDAEIKQLEIEIQALLAEVTE